MRRIIGLAASAIILVWMGGAAALADPPRIADASPFGVKRGEKVEVTLTGTNLAGNPRLVASFPFELEPTPPERNSAGAWVFALTVPDSVALGTHPIRVQTDDGLSNAFPLVVGQLPQLAEVEDNNEFEKAQALAALPVVVEGRVAGADVDHFRFAGKTGETILIDAQCARIGSGVDPTIKLTLAGPPRRYVASAEDSPGLLTDARLVAELPEDGDYVVEIADARYAGGGRPVYRLTIAEAPMAEEVYPLGGRAGEVVGFELRGGTLKEPLLAAARLAPEGATAAHWPRFAAGALDLESARPLVVSNVPEIREPADPAAPRPKAVAPVVFNGRLDAPGEEDQFVLTVSPGQKIKVQVEAAALGSAIDGVLRVLNPKGEQIAQADDTPRTPPGGDPAAKYNDPDPSLTFDVPAEVSEVALVLRDLEKRGGIGFPYRINVAPAPPGFDLNLNEPQASVPKGGAAVVGVSVVRNGYDGPIELSVEEPPAGLTCRPGTIPAGQTVGAFSLATAADAAFPAAPLKVVGVGQGPNGPIREAAVGWTVLAQQGVLPTNAMAEEGLAAAPAGPSIVTLDAPAEPVEAIHGQSVSIPIKVARTEGADAALALATLPLPAGLTAPAANIAEKAGDGAATVAVAPAAALGLTTIGLTAKGKFGEVERTFALPAVTLNVVRPIDFSLEQPVLEIAPGATVELKGKVVRKGEFKEPVAVRVDGLPAGLTAEPATVAPDAADFVVKVVAAADAQPAEAAANAVAAFKLGDADYPFPPAPLAVKVVAAQPK